MTDVKHKVAASAKEAASKVKSAASQTIAKAKDQAEHMATDKKESAANRIGDYSSAIHESARSLEEKDPNIAWFTHMAADKLQEVSDYMRNRDFAALREDASGMARRHPAAFFGGMFVAGLLLGNLVKASQRKIGSTQEDLGSESMGMEAPPPPLDYSTPENIAQSEFPAGDQMSRGI